MLNYMLSPDTQAILLLCASFGQNRQTEPQPLTLSEYNAVESWLDENDMIPQDLLNQTVKNWLSRSTIGKLNSERLIALLERGFMLSLAVEKWTNQGLWILGRGDNQYPKHLKQKLRHSAPPIIYGVGNIELLSQGGLAIVGSRDVDEEGLSFTYRVVQTCAEEGINVISGGARGVDQASMLGVLATGGTSVGVVADSLSKTAVAGKYRAAIKEGRLTLISTYDPNASFSAGNAMGRNKYIYGLADYALVVTSSVGKGGTWAGATEAIERIKDVPIFVRLWGNAPVGNRELLKKGAKSFPEEPWDNSLKTLLAAASSQIEATNYQVQGTESERTNGIIHQPLEVAQSLVNSPIIVNNSLIKDIYEAVLPFILKQLDNPKDAKSLAQCLDVRKVQIEDWLSKAVKEGKVTKTKNPVAYVANKLLL
ncbi:DNA-processing protein DprA [Limnofasciculus baicalensis]|uniref:DNA-protecting protein DprA n=1 Tax=Limnofasciculus baicalensis BBK-W-15 TaxID=2699891 RepID=A0AAE3GQG0_9CYAN|nr:DNA-processing protein DprA [Limnofasciculus baicalensis]MCP2728003.1 DNA-protecting protein DprA [Limnofasciculus baicalensis BBK-W-15]